MDKLQKERKAAIEAALIASDKSVKDFERALSVLGYVVIKKTIVKNLCAIVLKGIK